MKTKENQTFNDIKIALRNHQSFVVEAGAGSGKTYTLIQTLRHLIDDRQEELFKKNQRIVCITFTNVAKDEIIERIEDNPLIEVYTIHEFLWSCMSSFQIQLKKEIIELNEEYRISKRSYKYCENLETVLIDKTIIYHDYGRNFLEGKLHHDDVILLANKMFEKYSMISIIVGDKYPYVFVDEYQDTEPGTIEALIDNHQLKNPTKVLMGFFGDSHQTIYDKRIGSLEDYYSRGKEVLKYITKTENYRSRPEIVNLLNKIRTNIKQYIPESSRNKLKKGKAKFIHAHQSVDKYGSIQKIKSDLETNFAWDFKNTEENKILYLTNRGIANQLSYDSLFGAFNGRYGQYTTNRLNNKDDRFIEFFIGTEFYLGLEQLMLNYEAKKYAEILSKPSILNISLRTHRDKIIIKNLLEEIIELRNKTIEDILDFVRNHDLLNLPMSIIEFEEYLSKNLENPEEIDRQNRDKNFYEELKKVNYEEVGYFYEYIENLSPFSTKHGTKGDEYKNVLLVIDDTLWRNYNFNEVLAEDETKNRYTRTLNLLYVCCSRAKENLTVVSLSEMNNEAKRNIENWFGNENVLTFDDIRAS